ncbi:2-oxoacid dehydrogenases acyltransferase-domain-containing protein [Schizophyllum amplum]|uniref:Dihydrolipoamide acetyltransferase component of pyruvate dehydrogenase complex n=1 Tax=Schizophyllum amplum TaxID=97359 RepID=A0A550CEB6_9AGAR|nr:2-oxoacid dehydrogenases acyltransferase-domain-containing protein [Auriculariopsis ampla]
MFARRLRLASRRPALSAHFHTSRALWKSLQKFKLADIGEGITECEVIKWSVKARSAVTTFDPLCEVQSDKASVEITSPFDGVVKELLVQEGEIAKVGEGLCLIEVDDEVLEEADPSLLEPQGASKALPKEERAGSSPSTGPSPAKKKHPMDPTYDSSVDGKPVNVNVLATPSVRYFARQNGVDLTEIAPGSGRDGRVEKHDIEAHISRAAASSSSSRSTITDTAQDVVVELGRTRYGMWKAMVKSLEVPHFGYSTTLDLTALHNLMPVFNKHIPSQYLPPSQQPLLVDPTSLGILPASSAPAVSQEQQYSKLTYLPILLKTLSRSMLDWPIFRASITPDAAPDAKPTLTVRPRADISIALSTPTGLYTPTLQGVDGQSVYSLASSLRRLSHLGRQVPCGLTPMEMPRRGGTLTVSNVGAIGQGDFAHPVLVPGGGVAIVAIGRAKWVWDVERGDGSGERRLKVGISWSADHRVVEGAELAAFVECWRGYVEAPERLIVDSV